MTAPQTQTSTTAGDVAEEAMHYIDVVDLFVSLGADSHAAARTRAARARTRDHENQTVQTTHAETRKGVRQWTR